MPFFTRILNFPRTLLRRLRNQRKQTRYPVGTDFTVLATINLSGDDSHPRKPAAPRVPGCDWNGQVSDLSTNGLSVRLSPAAATSRGEATTARLTLEGRELAIPCTVAHFRVYATHAQCGLRLAFRDFPLQKAYHQVVEAVSLGVSFTPVEGSRAPRTSQCLARRQWRSLKHSRLTEWRETGTKKLVRFELIIADHRIEGRIAEPGLAISSDINRGRATPAAVAAELRQLFLWVTANLPASVPADLKDFMRRTANPPVARSSTPKPPSRPPTELAPPKRTTRSPV